MSCFSGKCTNIWKGVESSNNEIVNTVVSWFAEQLEIFLRIFLEISKRFTKLQDRCNNISVVSTYFERRIN